MLPPSVRDELAAAKAVKSKKAAKRLNVIAGGRKYPVIRAWKTGFALTSEDGAELRGLVELYEGTRLLSQCLIVASQDKHGERRFEYKRATPPMDRQPVVDFVQSEDAPVGYLAAPK